ncbi:glycosyltransferase family 2 protein [Snuella lapsa]|uniref:Glycosyltransferase 2-like domain-containing protein n=1 Tax=Snuella lapsa TaxID=870481 RepID=A0ABP6XTS2_9FLAO
MNEIPLISIIIPTYNRAHLIGETLDSILVQTYMCWECLIIDDGSTDNTDVVISNYCKVDSRVKYYKRPQNRRKGANACRNYGLELSQGDFINWFDSDDVMFPNFIEEKVKSLLKNPLSDFVVTRGINFHENGETNDISVRNNATKKLDHNNFVLFEVFWVTPDFLVKKERIGLVRFDEEIKSGQEYNFFIKVLAASSLKGVFVDRVLFKRRLHKESIQGKFNGDDDTFCFDQYMLYKNTFLAVRDYLNEEAKAYMFRRIASRTFELKRRKLKTPKLLTILKLFKREKGWTKTLLFVVSLFFGYYFGKGFILMDKARS